MDAYGKAWRHIECDIPFMQVLREEAHATVSLMISLGDAFRQVLVEPCSNYTKRCTFGYFYGACSVVELRDRLPAKAFLGTRTTPSSRQRNLLLQSAC
jgi:hypothetical protein